MFWFVFEVIISSKSVDIICFASNNEHAIESKPHPELYNKVYIKIILLTISKIVLCLIKWECDFKYSKTKTDLIRVFINMLIL